MRTRNPTTRWQAATVSLYAENAAGAAFPAKNFIYIGAVVVIYFNL
jgi:hypothetical protein